MKLGALQVIDAFVRLGGTGEAAQGLGVSQSAVIKSLRLAEQELDLSLVATVQGRLAPTPEALELCRLARPAFDVLRRAHHEADMIRVGMADRLRIATVPGLAHSILPPAITGARLALGDRAAVEVMFDHVRDHLRDNEVDLAISYGPMATEGLRDIALRCSPLVCVLDEAHPLAGRDRLTRADLRGQRLISYGPDGFSLADSFQEALGRIGLSEQVAITVRHTDSACHLARESVGIAVVDGFVISSGLTRGLAVRPLDGIAVVDGFVISSGLTRGLAVRPLDGSPLVTAFAHHRDGGAPLDHAARVLLEHLVGDGT